MPHSTIETENNEENSSNSAEAGDNDQQSAAEVHDDMLGEPVEEAGLVSTTEFIRPEGDDEASGDDKSGAASEEDGDSEGDKGKELSDEDKAKLDATFQDSPRFQQLINQKNEAKAEAIQAKAGLTALEKQVETLTDLVKGLGGNQQQQQQSQQKPGYQDVLKLSDEQIIEGFESDPKGFLANFALQVKDEVTQHLIQTGQQHQQVSQAQQQEQAIENLYAEYESNNPDFVEAWGKGEVQKFLTENPGNTPISAWEIMKSRASAESSTKAKEKEIQEAVEKAVAEATKNFKVKQSSRTLSGGPGGGSQSKTNETPAELADTAKHGGLMTVLTQRSLAREKAK